MRWIGRSLMPNFPNIINSACIPTTPPAPDPRCGDPIFALLHPEICASSPFLRIKPGVLLACILGSVQFRAFTVQNGIETEVLEGIVWTVSDSTVALIGVTSGNATGIAAGTVTITAQSQGLTATATFTVLPGLNCCDANDVATVLVVDKSHSMSLQFGGGYATKQTFADYVASQYAIQTNTQKDRIGLIEFDSTAAVDSGVTSDASAVAAQAGAIVNSVLKTGIGLALQAAVDLLAPVVATTKVIVLISDGEDKDINPANDPVPIATAFKATGGIMFPVGVRAHGGAFNLMNAMSTGGFFVNTYASIVGQALQWIYGLKGYLCAGNCAPPGNTYENQPQLDYSAFTNWNVAGHVDLLGPGLFDVLPGNGLYVSLASNKSPWSGQLTSKISFSFTAGKTYRLSFYLGGNQRQNLGTQTVTAKIGDGSAFQQVIIIPNYAQSFTKFSFNFTPLADLAAPIIVSQTGDDSQGNYFGSLFNRVTLENITDFTLIFEDNFDGENLKFLPPGCGVGVLGGSQPIDNPPAPILTQWGLGSVDLPGVPTLTGVTDPNGEVAPYCVPGNITEIYAIVGRTADGGSTASKISALLVDANLSHNAVLITMPGGIDSRIVSIDIYRGICNPFNLEPWGYLTTIPASQATYTDILSTSQFNTDNPNGVSLSGSNTTAQSPQGSMDTGVAHLYAVSYKTAIGETKLSSTATITPAAAYSSIKITTNTDLNPFVTSKRIWRFAGGAFRLLNEISPGTADYYDIKSNAQFAAFYNPSIVSPATNTTAISTYTYYYGYNCYGYGCLSDPPGVQIQDPFVLPDIESDYVPPTTYTSTQSFTAKCPVGTVQKAVSATLSLPGCSPSSCSSVQTSGGPFPALTALAVNITASANSNGNLIARIEGSNDNSSWTTLVTSNPQIFVAGVAVSLLINSPASFAYYRVTLTSSPGGSTQVIPGTYMFEMLTATGSGGITESATATSIISQTDADAKALAAATLAANTELAQVGCATQYSSTQTATVKCSVGSYDGNGGQGVTRSATATSFASQADADALALAAAQAAAQAALNCSQSNNTQAITINDSTGTPTAATPYPSVSFQSGLGVALTRIRVNILNYVHAYAEDVGFLLISPTGKKVLLMLNCGGANSIVTPVNLIFDSNSVTALPDATPISSGTYKSTVYGVQFNFPSPAPAGAYLTAFTTLIGDNPNGAWSLWVVDSKTLDVGAIQNGWTLTIDA